MVGSKPVRNPAVDIAQPKDIILVRQECTEHEKRKARYGTVVKISSKDTSYHLKHLLK